MKRSGGLGPELNSTTSKYYHSQLLVDCGSRVFRRSWHLTAYRRMPAFQLNAWETEERGLLVGDFYHRPMIVHG